MKHDSFDDIIRQKALDHEAPVPPGTWEAITEKKKKKRRYPVFWWITAGLLLAGFTAWGLYYDRGRSKETVTIVETKHDQATVKTAPVKTTGEKVMDQKEFVQQRNSDTAKTLAVKESGITKEQETLSSQPVITVSNENVKENSLSVSPGRQSNTSENGNYENSNPAITKSSNHVTAISVPGKLKKVKQGSVDHKTVYTPVKSNNQSNSLQIFSETVGDNITGDNNAAGAGNFLFATDKREHSRMGQLIIAKRLNIPASDLNAGSLILSRIDSLSPLAAPAAALPVNKLLKKDKWTLDISVTPFLPWQQNQSVLYLTRTRTGNMEKSEYKTDKISSRLQPSVSYAVTVHRKMNERFRLGAGLQYAVIKEKVDLTGRETRTTYYEVQRLVNGSSGPQLIKDTVTMTSTGSLTIDALNSYRLLSIPVSVQYDLLQKKRWSLQLNGGFVTTVSGIYHNDIQGKLLQFDSRGMHTGGQNNSIAFDLFAGLRVSKNYHSFRLFAEPVLRYNISGYDLSTMINRKSIHQAGLSVGITYLLGH